jgi:hypothetical protein
LTIKLSRFILCYMSERLDKVRFRRTGIGNGEYWRGGDCRPCCGRDVWLSSFHQRQIVFAKVVKGLGVKRDMDVKEFRLSRIQGSLCSAEVVLWFVRQRNTERKNTIRQLETIKRAEVGVTLSTGRSLSLCLCVEATCSQHAVTSDASCT